MRARPPFALAACALLALLPGSPRVSRGEDLLAQYAATDRFRSGAPREFALTPDGREVLFLRSGPRDRVGDLYALDIATGSERVVLTAKQLLGGGGEHLTAEELARRERLRLAVRGIASFELSPDGRRLLVPLSGRLFVIERASGAVRELSPGTTAAEDAHFSPDGSRIACVRGGDVHVIELASGAEHAVTAHPSDREGWGSPEFVAQEEMDRFAGWWWSPDSRSLLVQHTDESKVERMRIADPAHPETPPQEWAYPRAGTTNADVRVALVPVAGGAPRWIEWDRARYPYLCAAAWSKHGPPTLVVMDRDQQQEAVLAVDTASCETRALLVERDEKWLNLRPGSPRWLAGGRGWLWIAERDDTGPWLERRTTAGAVSRLSPPGLRVHELLGVDNARGFAYVLASDDPRQAHVWRLPLAGGRPLRMGADAGIETAKFADESGMHVRTLNARDGGKRYVVEDGDGRARATVRSLAEAPALTPNIEWTTVGADSLHAMLIRPRDFKPGQRYPVIEWVYGGPHYCQVEMQRDRYAVQQWLADHGFVVVSMDGRGTPWRGRAWERAIRSDLIGPALADHREGLAALCARYPELDPGRIGIFGWSFGGYFTVMAVERAGDVYRAGVSGAPVIDWRDYDTFYTERYLGLPQRDSLAYQRSSALTDAAKIRRPLLVIHGTADDNVYFFNSLKLADALGRALVPFDFLPLPGQTHSVNDPALQREYNQRMADYFARELGHPEPLAPRP
jgi:dipeptidyl-peptidase-4